MPYLLFLDVIIHLRTWRGTGDCNLSYTAYTVQKNLQQSQKKKKLIESLLYLLYLLYLSI